jgi:Fe-S cluster assembly ATP-binding protein
MLLKINNLEASIENKKILKKFNLEVKENEIHVIMGPNGSGKSTFSKILAGHPAYTITGGEIFFENKNFLNFSAEIRSNEGLFLAFQYPLEISGITNYDFLRLAYNQKKKYLGENEVTPIEFMSLIDEKAKELKIPNEFLVRDLNQGFSGGEKKRNEILQMLLLEPKLIILDELDSGLDIDAMKLICQTILKFFSKKSALIIITHYPRILNYFKPDFVHIMIDGKIIKTGNLELIETLEKEGYKNMF